jgi:HK97 gp10 family phage protein
MSRISSKSISMSLTGEEFVKRMFNEVGPAAAIRISSYASGLAMERVVRSAQSRARGAEIMRTGLLAESIGSKNKTYKRKKAGTIVVVVGPRTGFEKGVWVDNTLTGTRDLVMADPVKYAHLVEFGTQPHRISQGSVLARTFKSGRKQKAVDNGGAMHPGTPPRPFMRPALESNAKYVVGKLSKEIGAGLERELARLAKKQARGK